MYTNSNASVNAVQNTAASAQIARLNILLQTMKGWLLESRAKKPTLAKKIIEVVEVESSPRIAPYQASFIFEVKDEVYESVPIYIRAVAVEEISHKRQSNLWGPIQDVAITSEDNNDSIIRKVKQALINGYKHVSHYISQKVWRHRIRVLKRMELEKRHPRTRPERVLLRSEQWCPRHNFTPAADHRTQPTFA